jgi:hypothetical protein
MLLRWHFLPIRHRPPFGERVVRAIHTYKLQNFFLNFRLSLFLNFLPPISRVLPHSILRQQLTPAFAGGEVTERATRKVIQVVLNHNSGIALLFSRSKTG